MITKKDCLIIKVDFKKAYDLVDWGFLKYMLRRMSCVFWESMYILVNGSPRTEINIQRGLKQMDLLAPFLFLLVAEDFSGLMRNVVNLNLFEGFRFMSDGMVISHL